jgi:hypothetical protein
MIVQKLMVMAEELGVSIEPLMSELRRLVNIIGIDESCRLLGYTNTNTNTNNAPAAATNTKTIA